MFVTRCVECNHEELTVNPECLCKCHTPAPQPSQVERYALLDRIAALEAAIEADRTRIIDGVNRVERALNGYFWLTEGRGSYEWDDDRYRKEFGEAVRDMLKAVEPLRRIGADLKHCPQTTAEVIEARRDLREQLATAHREAEEARARLAMATNKVDAMSQYPDPEYVIETCREIHAATATAVDAFLARVKRKGAAEQIKRLLDTFERGDTKLWLTGEYLRVRDGISDNPYARVWAQRVSDGYWLGYCETGWIADKPEVAGHCVSGIANRAIKQMRMKLKDIRLIEGEPAGAHRKIEARAEELRRER